MSRVWRVGVIDHCKNKAKGSHGVHLAFSGLPNAEIVAVADPDTESRDALQRDTAAARQYAEWEDLLGHEKPDIICLCSRLPTHHVAPLVGSVAAGCHIYCEKPMAIDLADADRMVAAAEAAGVHLAVAHLARYAPVFQHTRELIRSGGIGRPLSVHCRGKEDNRGGGEDMLVLGSHLLDLARFFFGDPQWVFGHVTTEGRDTVPEDAHDPTEPVGRVAGDAVVALYGFADGVRGHFESRRDLYDEGDVRMGITVIGAEATLSVRYDDNRVLQIRRSRRPLEEGGDREVIPTPVPSDPPGARPLYTTKGVGGYFAINNRLAALDLIAAIEEGREPLASGSDAAWSLEMVHGVYASHFHREALPLPLADRRHPLDG